MTIPTNDNNPSDPTPTSTSVKSTPVQNKLAATHTADQPYSLGTRRPTKPKRALSQSIYSKMFIIGCLCIGLLVGLWMIENLVYERQSYYRTVMRDIAKTQVGRQRVVTPFISTPATRTRPCTDQASINARAKLAQPPILNCEFHYKTPVIPINSEIKTDFEVVEGKYYRSIYDAISYTGSFEIKQTYARKDLLKLKERSLVSEFAATDNDTVVTHWQDSQLILPIADLRGLGQLASVTIAGKTYQMQYPDGSERQPFDFSYIDLPISKILNPVLAQSANTPIDVVLRFKLEGLSGFTAVALGQNFKLKTAGNWQDAKYYGDALPTQKTLDESGFSAVWQSSYLVQKNNQQLTQCLGTDASCHLLRDFNTQKVNSERPSGKYSHNSVSADNRLNEFNIEFIDTSSVYTLTDRSIKYGLLLILVTFATFFLFEIIKSLRIHPMQYLLVGSALLVFYVLLLSLAEYTAFWIAYCAASVACISLIGWYAAYVLHSNSRAALFSLVLASLYGVFYLILSFSDINLLLGAGFCFVMLAAVMYLTRHIDWYNLYEEPSHDLAS